MWNKNRFGWLMLVMACALLVPATAFAEEEKKAEGEPEGEDLDRVVFELSAAVYSKQVWRGTNVVDDWVLQAQFDVMWRGFTFTGWGNIDLTDENGNKGQFSEVDLIADYGLDLGPVGLNFGAIAYMFREPGINTLEIYVGAGLNMFLEPTLTLYHDVDEAEGNYLALSVRHVFDRLFQPSGEVGLSPEITASLAYADIDYNAYYNRAAKSGFADLTLGFAVPWKINETFTIFASIHYSILVDSTMRDRAKEGTNVWLGIGASMEF